METRAPLHRIVLTGGPCAGKTAALALVSARLQALGWRVYRVPEAATLLTLAGAPFANLTPEERFLRQSNLLAVQLAMEDALIAIARGGDGPATVLCDRGAMDGAAFLTPDAWERLLAERGLNETLLRDGRYEAVLHLATADADAYTLESNPARSEAHAAALALDRRTREAWTGHPHLRVIPAVADFDAKLERVTAAILRALGIPQPLEIERKYLVRACPPALPVHSVTVEIEQWYLRTPDAGTARIRRRGRQGHYACTHTVKQDVRPGERIEIERAITVAEYDAFRAQADPARRPIRKTRTSFLWGAHYFELDTFHDPHPGLCLLEVELDAIDEPVELPPFLEIERDVTDEPAYTNAALAKG